jgi:hypothetical protein
VTRTSFTCKSAHLDAADIPGFSKSSGGRGVVCPCGLLVVGGAGFQAAVEDADEAVRELSERGLVSDLSVAELLVVGPCPR